MQEITLKSLIYWVKQNFPAKVIDEVSGAEVIMENNQFLQMWLEKLKKKMEQIIEDLDVIELYDIADIVEEEILGESDE